MKTEEENGPSRRTIIKGLAAAAGVTAAAVFPGESDAGILSRIREFRRLKRFAGLRKVIVYRLRSRGTIACRACQKHHRYIVFLSRALADVNRAHKGCNCPIVEQEISRARFRALFPRGTDGIARLRRGYG